MSFATKAPYIAHERELKNDIKLWLNGIEAVDLSFMTLLNVASGAPMRRIVPRHPTKPISSAFSQKARPVTNRHTITNAPYTDLLNVGDMAS